VQRKRSCARGAIVGGAGHWNADPSQLRTDVYYLLQAASAEAKP